MVRSKVPGNKKYLSIGLILLAGGLVLFYFAVFSELLYLISSSDEFSSIDAMIDAPQRDNQNKKVKIYGKIDFDHYTFKDEHVFIGGLGTWTTTERIYFYSLTDGKSLFEVRLVSHLPPDKFRSKYDGAAVVGRRELTTQNIHNRD